MSISDQYEIALMSKWWILTIPFLIYNLVFNSLSSLDLSCSLLQWWRYPHCHFFWWYTEIIFGSGMTSKGNISYIVLLESTLFLVLEYPCLNVGVIYHKCTYICIISFSSLVCSNKIKDSMLYIIHWRSIYYGKSIFILKKFYVI